MIGNSSFSITLTDAQLYRLLLRLSQNITLRHADTAILTTDNITDHFSTTVEPATVAIYVSVFFLWYGGLIFVCLIGLGVYKKPNSYEIYKKFVDRQDLKEQIKREKQEEKQQKQMLKRLQTTGHSNSCTSIMMEPPHYEMSDENDLESSGHTTISTLSLRDEKMSQGQNGSGGSVLS